MTVYTYSEMELKIRSELISTYQAGSYLGLFPSEVIGDYEVREWGFRVLNSGNPAAIGISGFNPNQLKFAAKGGSYLIVDVNQETTLEERDLLMWQKMGALPKNLNLLAEDAMKTANKNLFMGTDGNGAAGPVSQYNYLLAEGSSNGTIIRPNLVLDQSGDGSHNDFATVAYMRAMINDLLTNLWKYYRKETTWVLYPKAATPAMYKVRNDYKESAISNIVEKGVPETRILPIEDEYFYTVAGAEPTNALFDLVAIDASQFSLGYTRDLEVRDDYDAYHRSSKWAVDMSYCFLPIPKPVKTYVYKGMTRIKAIVGT